MNTDDRDNKVPTKFHIDYSVKGTAKCKQCKKLIDRGDLRFGKPVPYKDRMFLQYYHVPCMFKHFHKARVASCVVTDTDSLTGFTDLSKEDQVLIKKLTESENDSRNKDLPSSLPKRKPRVSPEAPLHVRKARLKSSNNESLNVLFTNAD